MSGKRNLPSWMSSKAKASSSDDKPIRKKPSYEEEINDSKQTKNNGNSSNRGKAASGSDAPSFSKLLEGVVFVLSGFVNPERSTLRSQALEMGAEYKQDWNSDCTLLICAFPNTPKFRQVQADCGTIVSKEWIAECYNQKKLVDIDTYLMHAGKPWRKSNISQETDQGHESTSPDKQQKQPSTTSSKAGTSKQAGTSNRAKDNHAKELLSPIEVKKWAIDDLNKTISWLESQEERPQPSEIKKIAAEGILTCLQDAIESLEQNKDIERVTEQWNFVPRVVEELARLEGGVKTGKKSPAGKDIHRQAVTYKQIYETAFDNLDGDSPVKKKKAKSSEDGHGSKKVRSKSSDESYDSDETIEMTEEEIDQAFNAIASKN